MGVFSKEVTTMNDLFIQGLGSMYYGRPCRLTPGCGLRTTAGSLKAVFRVVDHRALSRTALPARFLSSHYHSDEADSLRKQHVPGRRQRIAGRVNEPGDAQLRGATEAGDGDGIDRGEGAATDVLGQALRKRHVEGAVGNGANQCQDSAISTCPG